jgi:hypothetical protein
VGREFGKPEDEQYQNCGLHGKDGKGVEKLGKKTWGWWISLVPRRFVQKSAGQCFADPKGSCHALHSD